MFCSKHYRSISTFTAKTAQLERRTDLSLLHTANEIMATSFGARYPTLNIQQQLHWFSYFYALIFFCEIEPTQYTIT